MRSLLILTLCASAAVSIACKEEGTIRVHSLTLKGTSRVSDATLKSVLATHAGSKLPWGRKAYFDRARFGADLKRIQTYYVDRGYPDARVTGFDVKLNKTQDAVDITVTIAEGTPVTVAALNLVGFDLLPARTIGQLKNQIPLKVGQPRDRQLIVSTHEMAVNALRDRGYPYASVELDEEIATDGKSTALTLKAAPGTLARFGPSIIEGNRHVSANVIRRGLSFKEGDLYRRSQMQDTQRRLYATELFEFVNVAPAAEGTKSTEPGSESIRAAGVAEVQTPMQIPAEAPANQPDRVPTRITVAEGKPRRINFGAGYGTEEKIRADAEYHLLNFFGGGRTAGAHTRWSSLDRGVRGDFTQPYLFSPAFTLTAMGQQWRTLTPAYEAVVTGGKLTVTHRTSVRTFWSIPITIETDSSTVAPAVLGNPGLRNGLIALGLNPITGTQRGTLHAIGFDFQYSTADNLLNARRGHQATFHIEQAGQLLPGTFKYWSASVDGRQYTPLGAGIVWANRVQAGNIAARNDNPAMVPFGKRFFLGGSTSIRGWGIYEVGPRSGGLPVGGDSMLAFSSEIRARLKGKLGGVVFIDGGNVWAGSFEVDLKDLLYAAGAGLRYVSPVGPIRFDAGFQLNREPDLLINGQPQSRPWRVHFSVGHAF